MNKQVKKMQHVTQHVSKVRVKAQAFLQIYEKCFLQTNLTLEIFPHLY